MVCYEMQYDDKTIDVFREKKLWATTFFLCPLYIQPVFAAALVY